jgi:hypothetical protein
LSAVTAIYISLLFRYGDCLLLWLLAMVGLVLSVRALARALDRNSCLRLTPRGFAVHDRWAVLAFSWNEIESFSVGNRGRSVLFNYADRGDTASGARKLAHFVAGGDGALPDTYGMSAEDLAALLTRWHERFRPGNEERERPATR